MADIEKLERFLTKACEAEDRAVNLDKAGRDEDAAKEWKKSAMYFKAALKQE